MRIIDTWNEGFLHHAEALKIIDSYELMKDIYESSVRGEKWCLPIFLYSDKNEKNSRSDYISKAVYGGGESHQLEVHGSMNRDLLKEFSIGNSLDDEKSRGVILNAFCQIDFCLDVLICIEMGAYTHAVKPETIRKELREAGGIFVTTSKKLKYLKHKHLIRSETYEKVQETKKIRNKLAHQFMPDYNNILAKKLKEKYNWRENDTISEILRIEFNESWHLLLKDFVRRQDVVVNYLNSKKTN